MINHEIATTCRCDIDHTGIVICLGFAAFFAIISVIFNLLDRKKY